MALKNGCLAKISPKKVIVIFNEGISEGISEGIKFAVFDFCNLFEVKGYRGGFVHPQVASQPTVTNLQPLRG